jgi:phosphatidate cytidylyltransferase
MTVLASEQQALMLAAAVAGVLVLATLVGFALKIAVAKGRPHGVIDNLNTRVNAWWVMCALFALALAGGRAGVAVLFAFVSWAALREFATAGLDGRRDAGTWMRGFVPCVVCIAHAPALLLLDIPGYEGRNAFLLLYLIVVVQSGDVFQYIWGKLAGRRRIAPRVSPSKTLEGAIGGIASATALGVLLTPITPFTALQALGIAFVLALSGFAGGLMMSAAKRARGIKDWGTLVKGHGGVLDRIDSLILAAPLFFYAVYWGWA